MRKLALGVAALVLGAGLVIGGLVSLASHDVTCKGRPMKPGDSCQHVSRRGVPWTNDYAKEKSSGETSGYILAGVGLMLLLGAAVVLYDGGNRRRQPASGAPGVGLLPVQQGNMPPANYARTAPQYGLPAAPPVGVGHSYEFTQPVELRCVINADATVQRAIPQLVAQAFAVWLLAALFLGMMAPDVTVVWLGGSIAVSAASVAIVYVRKRDRLRYTYGQLQRLILHSGGLRRFDASVVIDMPWTGLTRFEWRNSSLPSGARVLTVSGMAGAANAAADIAHTAMAWGIVGGGTVTPLAGASPRMLNLQDQLYHSNLAGGYPHSSPNCLIFPAEFETDWANGIVGSWLRHYRPDLTLPTMA